MVVDFGGEAVAELDPRHPSVSVVDGSFDDVEVFQLFEDPDHRAHGQPSVQIDVRRGDRYGGIVVQGDKQDHVPRLIIGVFAGIFP